MVVTVRDSGSMTRTQAMLRCVDEAKDGGPGCRRGHYHRSSVNNESSGLRTTPCHPGVPDPKVFIQFARDMRLKLNRL